MKAREQNPELGHSCPVVEKIIVPKMCHQSNTYIIARLTLFFVTTGSTDTPIVLLLGSDEVHSGLFLSRSSLYFLCCISSRTCCWLFHLSSRYFVGGGLLAFSVVFSAPAVMDCRTGAFADYIRSSQSLGYRSLLECYLWSSLSSESL